MRYASSAWLLLKRSLFGYGHDGTRAVRERESLAAPQFPRMDGLSHSRYGNVVKTFLYVMQADGTNVRIVADSLNLQGVPAWAPDG
jgi:hypothetical protein